MNKLKLLSGIKSKNILNAPHKDESNNLFILVFLFKIYFTAIKSIKSIRRLSKNKTSKYITIISPKLLYKKSNINYVALTTILKIVSIS